MDLYKQILVKILEGDEARAALLEVLPELREMMETECCQALQKIKEVLEDDTMDDEECFQKIEGIVEVFEELGSGAGNRHDFG